MVVLKNKSYNIYFAKIKILKFKKTEIKKILLKSIIQNKNIKPIIRASAIKKITKFKINSSISRQKSVCLKTGKHGGIYKIYNMSRHYIHYMAKFGNLQSTKIASW